VHQLLGETKEKKRIRGRQERKKERGIRKKKDPGEEEQGKNAELGTLDNKKKGHSGKKEHNSPSSSLKKKKGGARHTYREQKK